MTKNCTFVFPVLLGLFCQNAVAASQVCQAGSSQGMVTFGAYTTNVPNKVLHANCTTLDDVFADEAPWGSARAFRRHVAQKARPLLAKRQLSAKQHARLLAAARASKVGTTLTIKLIAFNDFHGHIKAEEGSASNPGVARFATRIKALKVANPLHAVVSAGDMIGASPLTSALFKDEPTIEAMNRIGIDFNAVGNHEFDEGRQELLRMQQGGNHPSDPYSGRGMKQDLKQGQFAGAGFQFLAANVRVAASGRTLLPSYGVKHFLGHAVAFIGMTLQATPDIVSPAGVAGLSFEDEADTVNTLVPPLQKKGIKAIVVLIHEGGFPAGGKQGCEGLSGPVVDIVNRLDPEVDLVVTGHTHQTYNCDLLNRAGKRVRVTSAGQYARHLSDIDVTLDTRTGDVQAVVAANIATGADAATAPDPALEELVAHYDSLSAAPKSRVIGTISGSIKRTANAAGESALGGVLADAQLQATQGQQTGQAQMAFMNPGGMRADLNAGPGGQVTYGDAFTSQPFGNALVTVSLTGEQFKTLLETQFAECNGQGQTRVLQVSAGFNYTYHASADCGSRITAMALHGQSISPSASDRVTVNNYLADGGDAFAVLKAGVNRMGGPLDLDALEAYLQAHPEGVSPGPQNRITRLP